MDEHDHCHETVDPATRDEMLTKYNHKCQACGRCGPAAGGLATLHVHHLTRDVEEIDEHDPENLTVLCRACHSWQHQQTSEDEVTVDLTEEDVTALLPQDIEILRILDEAGPATTGNIASALSADLTVTAVRERLWVLMGLDNMVESRDRQVIDQDYDTGEWGLVEQIEHSSRGRIPNDAQLLLQRAEDEYVRRALERGCDRDAVMAVLDISRRTTFYKEKRARAYDFPLAAIGSRNGGRPRADDTDGAGDTGDARERAEMSAETQQQLDMVADGMGTDKETPVDATEQTTGDALEDREQRDTQGSGEQVEIREHVQQAITSLQALEEVL